MKEMTLKEQQNFFLDIMKDVHKFCVENNIKYSLYGGSMIGAIRHKGYIPWDDDVDIIMPRADYNRFCAIYKSDKFEVIDTTTDESCLLAFARVCDLKQTYVKTSIPWCSRKTGCWIDVFPADGFPANKDEQEKLYQQCYDIRAYVTYLRHVRSYFKGGIKSRLRQLLQKIIRLNGYGARRYVSKLIKVAQTYDYDTSPMWASLTCMKGSRKWQMKHHPKDTFDHCILMPFEDTELYVMNGFDSVLTQRYGDYMKLPPVAEQQPLHKFATCFWKNK